MSQSLDINTNIVCYVCSCCAFAYVCFYFLCLYLCACVFVRNKYLTLWILCVCSKIKPCSRLYCHLIFCWRSVYFYINIQIKKGDLLRKQVCFHSNRILSSFVVEFLFLFPFYSIRFVLFFSIDYLVLPFILFVLFSALITFHAYS